MSPLMKKASVIAVMLALGGLATGCGGDNGNGDNGNGIGTGDNGNGNGGDNGGDNGNGDDNGNGGDEEPIVPVVEINGAVEIPGVEWFQQEVRLAPAFVRLAGDFLVGSAQADMVAYWVQLVRLTADGPEPVQLADGSWGAMVSISGNYTLQLPSALEITSDMVLRVVTENVPSPAVENVVLRTIATGGQVDITPVGEFVLRELEAVNVDLASLASNEVVRIAGRIQELGVPTGSSLDETLDAIGELAATVVRNEVEEILTPPAQTPILSGRSFAISSMGLALGLENGNESVHVGIETGRRLDMTQGDATDRLNVTVGPGSYLSARIEQDSFYGAPLHIETEIDPESFVVEGFRVRADGRASFDRPLEEELGGEDFAMRVLPETFRVHSIPLVTPGSQTLPYALVGMNRETELLFGRLPDADGNPGMGAIDLSRSLGKREEFIFDIAVENRAESPVLQDRYGLVNFSQFMEEGSIESGNLVVELSRVEPGEDAFGILTRWDEDKAGGQGSHGGEFLLVPAGLETLDMIPLPQGKVLVDLGEEEPFEMYAAPEGQIMASARRELYEEGDWVEVIKDLTLAVAIDDIPPDVANTTWRLYGVEAFYNWGTSMGLMRDLSASNGTPATFCAPHGVIDSIALNPSRFTDIERVYNHPRLEDGTPVVNADDYMTSFRIGLNSFVAGSNGNLGFSLDENDGEIFSMNGFISKDGQVALLATRETVYGQMTSAGVLVGVRADFDQAACDLPLEDELEDENGDEPGPA